jgi:hypothetical protein
MVLIDNQNEFESVTLPQSGSVPVGVELPDGLDLDLLKREVNQFYGDRFQVAEKLPEQKTATAADFTPKNPRRRRN